MNGQTLMAKRKVLASALAQVGLTVDDILLVVNDINDTARKLKESEAELTEKEEDEKN